MRSSLAGFCEFSIFYCLPRATVFNLSQMLSGIISVFLFESMQIDPNLPSNLSHAMHCLCLPGKDQRKSGDMHSLRVT